METGVSQLRSRLEELLLELEQGAFRIPAGKIKEYRDMLEDVRALAEAEAGGAYASAEVSELNGNEEWGMQLDQRIVELFPLFINALVRGKESTAESGLKAILDSIRYSRRPVAQGDPEQITHQMESRVRALEHLSVAAQLQDHLDELETRIQALEENQIRLDEERDSAGTVLVEMQQQKSYLKDEVALYRESGLIIGNDFLQYVQTVNRFMRSGNISRKNALVLERQRESYAKIETVLRQVNLMAFGTSTLLGNVELDRLQALAKDFSAELAREQQQAEELKRVTERVDETIETYGEKAHRENIRKIEESSGTLQEWLAMKRRESAQKEKSPQNGKLLR